MYKLKEALTSKGIHFYVDGNVIGYMTPTMSVDVTCEIGRYVVSLTNSEGIEAIERYRSANTIVRECL